MIIANGHVHYYHLDESILGGSGVSSKFLFRYLMKFVEAYSIAPDKMPCYVVSHLWAILFAYVQQKGHQA